MSTAESVQIQKQNDYMHMTCVCTYMNVCLQKQQQLLSNLIVFFYISNMNTLNLNSTRQTGESD